MSQDTHRTTPSYRADRWYVVNQAPDSPDEAEVSIYDAIGSFGIGAAQFVADLKAIKAGTIRVRLNTPGGEVFDATAIHNALREHPARVVVHVDGLAASAGSLIAMSGDEVRMADNAYMMIHEARGGAMGDAEELRRYAGVLEKMNDNVAAAYQRKTGKPRSHWRRLMAEETWFTAKEAKAEGLADTVYAAAPPEQPDPAAPTASFDFKAYNRVPADVLARFAARAAAQAPATLTNDQPAPEPSPRGDAPTTPEFKQETATMPTSDTTAPAPAPAAGNGPTPQGNPTPPAAPAANDIASLQKMTAQGYFDQGKAAGIKLGDEQAVNRLKAIVAVCPGKPEMALAAFLGGQAPEAARLAFDAHARAEAAAREVAEAKDREIARLNALLATGGVPGGVAVGLVTGEPEVEAQPGMEPKAQAEWEWEYKPAVRKGFSSKERYVAVRAAELSGRFRSQVAPTAAQE